MITCTVSPSLYDAILAKKRDILHCAYTNAAFARLARSSTIAISDGERQSAWNVAEVWQYWDTIDDKLFSGINIRLGKRVRE